jgi:hypothetical protein
VRERERGRERERVLGFLDLRLCVDRQFALNGTERTKSDTDSAK